MSQLSIEERLQAIEAELDILRSMEIPFSDGVAVAYSPTYQGGTAGGTTTYAADGQVGYYVRFGPLCFFYGRLQWTAATGTGDARISLPFTAANVTNLSYSGGLDTNAVTFANSTPTMLISPNTAYFIMRSPLTNAAVTVVQMEAAGIINFSGFFEVA